ncbi:PadR family transcriptional regulator [Kutzneria sp. CA-103260]|uniref:PadR family transcriptional regulator n=1 Tax=Kutzneria sp. CA-103260 TaxID=2802641 RepID=UPI001BA69B61|nr:PadR family transcriptional regulator [Kutzneria sp. CA-103260]QUQ63825.1 PadR family transcriptional regulator [Kutzneria sp. CA-103260]
MTLRNAVLAALLEGESSGYDLAKGFDATVANFWTATPQQLYRELEKMEADGLLSARVVQQESRPNKRMVSLTEAGRRALHEFTAQTPRPSAIRDELMVQIQAVDASDGDAVRATLNERKESTEAKLARYERRRARMLAGRTEQEYLHQAKRIGPYLTLMRGIAFEQENIRWIGLVLSVLDRRAAAVG